ncbi:MAG: hypothetical protein KBC48_00035 [Candidatus Pacebacteria bacterium]|nr:hypothetical protein [Candidatus Paceibacterota bacterium]
MFNRLFENTTAWFCVGIIVGFIGCYIMWVDPSFDQFPWEKSQIQAATDLQVNEEYRNELWAQMPDFADYNKLSPEDQKILAHAIGKCKVMRPDPVNAWEVTRERFPIAAEYHSGNPNAPGYVVVVGSVDDNSLGKTLEYVIYYYDPSGYRGGGYSYRISTDGKAYRAMALGGWSPYNDQAKIDEIKKGLLEVMEPKIVEQGDYIKPERKTNPDAEEYLRPS